MEHPEEKTLPMPLALTLWAALQAAIIAASSHGACLYSHMPLPPQQETLTILIVAQIVGHALLRPLLENGLLDNAALAALNCALTQAAALISGQPTGAALSAWIVVTSWMFAWGSLGALRRTRFFSMLLAAIATLLAVGAPILAYLRAEFQPDRSAALEIFFNPIAIAIDAARDIEARSFWISVPIYLAIAIGAGLVRGTIFWRSKKILISASN
jgi:hypothetical protein